eukprot:PITA_27472
MLALSAQMDWKLHQIDVKIAFLNGKIEEEVYIEQVEGFETFDRESHVCRLKRVLYRPKTAPLSWYTKIDNYFTGLGFTKSEVDANLYNIMVEGKLLIIIVYVDDLILTGDDHLIVSCKEDLAREFEMKETVSYITYLVWKCRRRMGSFFLSQGNYASEILRRFHMEKCKPMQTPLADWERIPSDRKSTSGRIFNLGSVVVSWRSRKQRLVALSSVEAKYMVASQEVCEAI